MINDKPNDDKTMAAKGLQRASQYDMTVPQFFEIVPENIEYQNIFHPDFWRHHSGVKPNSLIRVRHALGKFDVVVNVVHKVGNGLLVEFHHGRPPRGVDPYKVQDEARAEALRVQMAPIAADGKPVCRTQFLPKTRFRVLGLGGAEVARDLNTQVEAETVLANYLSGLNLRNPTEDELFEAAKKTAAAMSAAQSEKAPA
jgi:hypothetical protein